jgi:hypothetical protein
LTTSRRFAVVWAAAGAACDTATTRDTASRRAGFIASIVGGKRSQHQPINGDPDARAGTGVREGRMANFRSAATS